MKFRCKMKMVSTTVECWNLGARKFKFSAEYDSTIPEDELYAKYTPSGTIELTVDNPMLVANLIPGDCFYVDFTSIPKVYNV